MFLDNGCGKSAFTKDAVDSLAGNAAQVFDGSVKLGGVGGLEMETPHGEYQISLPLADGKNAKLTGIVLDQITHPFPTYTLNGEVESNIHSAFERSGGDLKTLPSLSHCIGVPSIGG